MIYINGKEVSFIYYGKKAISSVMKGSHLVWQAVRSCFGSGRWVNEKPWIDSEAWKNN